MEAEVNIPLGSSAIAGLEMEQLRPFFVWFGDLSTWLGETGADIFHIKIRITGKVIGTNAWFEEHQGRIGRKFLRPDERGNVVFVRFDETSSMLTIKISDTA